MPTTLIIGRYDDPHTVAVTVALKELGQEVICLDSYNKDGLSMQMSNTPTSELKVEIQGVDSRKFSSVWFRQKPLIPMPWWSPLQYDAERFSQNEWGMVLRSLPYMAPKAFWINSPENNQSINYKPKQIALAIKLRFNVPETLISNIPEEIIKFIGKQNKVIYKGLSGFIFVDQSGILTNIIDKNNIKKNIESVKKAPGIYQKFIEKNFEARVTVVGRRKFISKVCTPKRGLGYIDWRHDHFEPIFEEGELPQEISDKIDNFQKSAGLHYGAYDFIVSPDNKWYFLECNPGGQFLWLERALGFKISNAIAEDLINVANSKM